MAPSYENLDFNIAFVEDPLTGRVLVVVLKDGAADVAHQWYPNRISAEKHYHKIFRAFAESPDPDASTRLGSVPY